MKRLKIPILNGTGEKGNVYYCVDFEIRNKRPLVHIKEGNATNKFLLPIWYADWIRSVKFRKRISLPTFVEFGHSSDNGNYFAKEVVYWNDDIIELDGFNSIEEIGSKGKSPENRDPSLLILLLFVLVFIYNFLFKNSNCNDK